MRLEGVVMKEKNNGEHPILNLKKPWDTNENDVCLASTIVLERNVEKFKFPGKLSNDRRKQVLALVGKEILTSDVLSNPVLYKAEDLNHMEKEFLMEHFLSSHSYHQASSGEAFILDDTGLFLTTFNLRNHLHLQIIDTTGDIEGAWNKLVKIETAIGKSISYSFSPRFGFLTADPSQCGTALLITVFLQLPALVHTGTINGILEKQLDEGISITSIQGNPTEIIGDVLAIQNNYTLGLAEETIIASLRSFTAKLELEEHTARNLLKKHESAGIKDKVSRAYGILAHSYQIDAIEALNAISLVKLGTSMGWITGVPAAMINQLFFKCRRAHLLSQYGEKINQEDVIHKRAEFVHQTLKDAKLTI